MSEEWPDDWPIRAIQMIEDLQEQCDILTAGRARAVAEEREACARAADSVLIECDCQNVAWRESAHRHIDEVVSRIRARQSTGAQECGVKGCTLPPTHGAEPHSWEHPHGDPPYYEPHGEPR
jgi:hypothetical protein